MTESKKCCGTCKRLEHADTTGRGLCVFAGIVLFEDMCGRWEAREAHIPKATA